MAIFELFEAGLFVLVGLPSIAGAIMLLYRKLDGLWIASFMMSVWGLIVVIPSRGFIFDASRRYDPTGSLAVILLPSQVTASVFLILGRKDIKKE